MIQKRLAWPLHKDETQIKNSIKAYPNQKYGT